MKHISLLKTEEIRLCLIFLKLSDLYFYLTVNDLIMIELLDICMIYWWCDWRMKDGLLDNKNTNFPKVFKVFPFVYFLLFSDRFSQVIVCVNLHEHTLFFHFTYLFLHIFTFFKKLFRELSTIFRATWCQYMILKVYKNVAMKCNFCLYLFLCTVKFNFCHTVAWQWYANCARLRN